MICDVKLEGYSEKSATLKVTSAAHETIVEVPIAELWKLKRLVDHFENTMSPEDRVVAGLEKRSKPREMWCLFTASGTLQSWSMHSGGEGWVKFREVE